MREIKFRAWDSKNKEFVYEFYINSNRTDYIQIIPEYLRTRRDSFIMTTNEDYELNQYTGLKDKNGKEIYEGDIVEWKYLNTWQRNEVKYIGDCFMAMMSAFKDDLNELQGISLISQLGCEIIGNIYENQDLLK